MPSKIRRHLTFANTIAMIALFVALGGTSIGAPVRDKTSELVGDAAASVGIGTRGAQKTSRRALRIAKRADRNAKTALARGVAAGERGDRGDKGEVGTKGDAGAKGDKGAAGNDATKLWAVVNSNGTLQRSDGVFDATRISAGNYKVYFEQNVRGCSYQATPGAPSTIDPDDLGTMFISVGSDPVLVNGVSVGIRNSANPLNSVDFPFHIAVFC